MSAENKIDIEPCRLLAVEFEPTHYKTDLWNVISSSELIDLLVIYTQKKNWAPDGGHNYLRFPKQNYASVVLAGRGLLGSLLSGLYVAKNIVKRKPDVVLICGYSHIQAIFAFLTAFILGKRFLIYVDEFNNKRPPGRFSFVKWVVREILRKFSFTCAQSVLVCGRKGVESAIKAGCAPDKVRDFPYVVDLKRIMRDAPDEIPVQCLADMRGSAPVLFFSGRMIQRKGLPSLLSAFSCPDMLEDWVLWIEGAGPELENYIALARQYGIADRCRFLGFCQYDLHSWLIRSSDIVIVPSLEDNWGIVVDEGLQLGKAVISSDATGSGYDRIIDKFNGHIFPAGDFTILARLLNSLIGSNDERRRLGEAAMSGPKNIRPADNLNTLLTVIR